MISIVVPVYKVEKYLNRCIKSLVHQSYTDLEIILVDDGSPDDCPILCDKWAQEDSKIKIIHKKNGGLSSARNAGLEIATGEYVGFVDSDDVVELNMYEKMYTIAKQENVDFVMSDYIRILESGETYLETFDIASGRYDKEKIRKEIYPQLIMGENLDYGPLLSVWHCLYRKEFLDKYQLHFDEEVRWSEDNIFSAFVGYYADSFYYMKGQGLYHYYQNPGTITTTYRRGAWQVYCTMNEHLHQFFDRVEDYDFDRQLKLHMIYYACNCIGQELGLLSFNEAKDGIKKILQSMQLKDAFTDFTIPNVHFKLKMQLYLMKWKLAGLLYLLKK